MRLIRNALVKIICALIIASVATYAIATNYSLTQGAGTTFGSLVIGGVNYAQHLICDATTPSQCDAVTATGGQVVDVATSNNNLYSAITAAAPCLNATTATTNTYTTGQTNGANCDLHGNLYANVSALPALVAGAAAIGTVTGNVNVTPTDCSGTIATGGTAQNAIAATATIHGFTIANIDSTTGSGEPLWISFTTTAAASTVASYPLSAPAATTFTGLSSYSSPLGFGLNHALSIIGATSAHKYSCTYW